jgi:hypothetical protein
MRIGRGNFKPNGEELSTGITRAAYGESAGPATKQLNPPLSSRVDSLLLRSAARVLLRAKKLQDLCKSRLASEEAKNTAN